MNTVTIILILNGVLGVVTDRIETWIKKIAIDYPVEVLKKEFSYERQEYLKNQIKKKIE